MRSRRSPSSRMAGPMPAATSTVCDPVRMRKQPIGSQALPGG